VLEIGEPAPDFSLPDADGREVTLSEFRGQPVVIYFYPRDDTPGCTKQACGIRDAWSEFTEAGAAVLGISPDDVGSHARFRDKHDLPHTLLADPDTEVIRAYGAWGKRKMYGRQYEGVIRSTVIVDAEGTVAARWPKVRPKEHADEVLAALSDL
jgi:thioredoxin-dependent peroxiredoxin